MEPTAIDAVGRLLDRTSDRHLYRQIADLLREQIRIGGLKPGDVIPSQRDLSVRWGIGEVTVRRAMQELAEQGLLEARAGGGTAVCQRQPEARALRDAAAPLSLGVAFADLANGYPFFAPLLAGMRSGPATVAVQLFDVPMDDAMTPTPTPPHLPALGDFDGLIMLSPVNLALIAACRQRRLPCVLLFSDVADGYSHCIVPDYGRGVAQTVRHLAGQGRRRVALVTPPADRFSTGYWIDALHTALQMHDQPADATILHADYTQRAGREAMSQLLASPHPPDAVILASDLMARGAMEAAHDAGIRVPHDLAIIGAGAPDDAHAWSTPLTLIDLGMHTMGDLARRTIESCLRGQPVPRRQSVPTTLIPGQTG